MLAEITAKGGALLLGVGPTPQGTIEPEVEKRLHEIGNWLRANGEAIYETRPTPVYNDGLTWFTGSKDGKTLYAIYALPEGEEMPATIEWSGNLPKGKMTLLDGNKSLKYKTTADGRVTVTLPTSTATSPSVELSPAQPSALLPSATPAPKRNGPVVHSLSHLRKKTTCSTKW